MESWILQDTTAAFLTAALASKQGLTSQTSERVPSDQGTQGINESTSSTDDSIPSQGVGELNSEIIKERNSQGDMQEVNFCSPFIFVYTSCILLV